MHLDKHLGNIIAEQGRGRAYALLAAIVFCETGLVNSSGINLVRLPVSPKTKNLQTIVVAGACHAFHHVRRRQIAPAIDGQLDVSQQSTLLPFS